MLFVDLDDLGEQVDRARVVAFLGGLGRIPHVFDHHEQVCVRLFDPLAHGPTRRGRVNVGRLLHLSQLDVLHVLSDHANAFCHLVNRAQHVVGEFVEHQVQVPKERPKRLPMIVFVVRVENEGIGHLALQVLHDRMVFPILL